MNFLGRREYVGRKLGRQMSEPYKRIVIMHVTIIFGGMLTIDCGTRSRAEGLMDVLQNEERFGFIAVSLGYYDTLMSCSGSSTSSELAEEDRAAAGIHDGLVRISAGITGTLEQRLAQLDDALDELGIPAAGAAAWGFLSLYNLPEAMALIRGQDRREPYWRRVLEYGSALADPSLADAPVPPLLRGDATNVVAAGRAGATARQRRGTPRPPRNPPEFDRGVARRIPDRQEGGTATDTVVPQKPTTESRAAISTVVTPSGITTPVSDRVNGCSSTWGWYSVRVASTRPSGATTSQRLA